MYTTLSLTAVEQPERMITGGIFLPSLSVLRELSPIFYVQIDHCPLFRAKSSIGALNQMRIKIEQVEWNTYM